jgi:hypothetical protein
VEEVKVEEKALIQKTVEKQIEENVGGASEHFFSNVFKIKKKAKLRQ